MQDRDFFCSDRLRTVAGPKQLHGITLHGLGGSVLDYRGDAIVNAANTGGVTGFGVDEQVNRAGGPALKKTRHELFHASGIPTGTCGSTPSFEHTAVKWIIHAVGPVLRETALSKETLEEKLDQLAAAYESSLIEAAHLGCENVGFSLLSCGVFRGSVPLETCIEQAIKGIRSYGEKKLPQPSSVCLIAFTDEEQEALAAVLNAVMD